MKLKTLLTFSTLFLSCCALNAQIEKGNVLLGGSFNYGSTSNSGYNTNSNAGISPRISYAIGKNSVIGLSGNFNYGVNKSATNDDKQITSGYGASLFWRKYMPIQNKLGWYAEVNGGVTGWKNEYKGNNTSSNTATSYSIGALPGLFFQAMPKLLVNVNVGGVNFNRSINKNSSSTTSRYSSFNVNFLSSFTFGVEFILGKKSQS